MNQKQIDRIVEMERILNETQKILENLQDAQQKWLENFENFQKLSDYYSSAKCYSIRSCVWSFDRRWRVQSFCESARNGS